MNIKQFTEKEAIELANTKWWVGKTPKEICDIQMYQDRLCMDFKDFHKAIEEALGRSVWTHEFADHDGLIAEYEGKREPEYNPIESATRILKKCGRNDLIENIIVVKGE
jgi:hypothetical protein